MTEPTPLRPARIERDDTRRIYGPKVPWRWVAAVVLIVGVVSGMHWWREHQKAEGLRTQILEAHRRSLGPVATRYQELLRSIVAWTTEAAKQPPQAYADPRVKLQSLHRSQGLYLRLQRSQAGSEEAIAAGARAMDADAITRCMGVAPISAKGLFEQGSFLLPSFVERARNASSVMALRVLDEELMQRSARDLPAIANMLRSEWFMLVLQDGPTRSTGPVDVFLWGLRDKRALLRVRTQARGVLIPFRYVVPGAPAAPRIRTNPYSPGAADCSIAAQVKELTGEPAMDFTSDVPAVDAGTPVGAPASMPSATP